MKVETVPIVRPDIAVTLTHAEATELYREYGSKECSRLLCNILMAIKKFL